MSRQEPPELPASLRAAWGLESRSGRGPKPGLSLEQIVDAAVQLADSQGLSAVSMARVAQELGASTMSLYRYVAAKDELLALMVDAASGPPPTADPDEGWRESLARWARVSLEGMLRHLWAVQVPITGPPTTPNQVAWLEQGLRALAGTPLPEEEKASVVLLVSGYVRNQATLAAQLGAAEFVSDAAMSAYSRLLGELTEGERFPAIGAVLAAGVFDRADPPEKEFEFGLQRILDGVGDLVRLRAADS